MKNPTNMVKTVNPIRIVSRVANQPSPSPLPPPPIPPERNIFLIIPNAKYPIDKTTPNTQMLPNNPEAIKRPRIARNSEATSMVDRVAAYVRMTGSVNIPKSIIDPNPISPCPRAAARFTSPAQIEERGGGRFPTSITGGRQPKRQTGDP